MIPAFDQDVPHHGYAWWYLDAISDDGRHGLTLIAFVGSVFSPYYAWARARGRGDPLAHCAINVALYGPGGRWSMTERDGTAVVRERERLTIGPSGLRWSNDCLTIDLNEWSVPIPRRVRGRIRVRPGISSGQPVELDPEGRHVWTPVMPKAHVEVTMHHPGLDWSGTGYLDHNAGSEPLEKRFDSWTWSRAMTSAGPVVLYETQLIDGERRALALHFDPSGTIHTLPESPPARLPTSRWGVERSTRSDDGNAGLQAVWEDTPFYNRSLVTTRVRGEHVKAVHESLSLRRFKAPWVQMMLPFRMPRRSQTSG